MEKSLLEFAFDYVSKQKDPVSFTEIWEYVVKESGISAEEAKIRVARFYTNLSLDGRFVTLGENEWDLRNRHTFDKVHIDMKDVYNDVEATDEDSEEAEDSDIKEYNEVFEEPKDDTEDSSREDSEQEETL